VSARDLLRSALRGVSANKLRSSLTVLGILIGVGAVILLVAFGNGSAKQIADRIEALGTNTLTISANRGGGAGRVPGQAGGAASQQYDLTVADAHALTDRNLAPDVATASPVLSRAATLTAGGTSHDVPQVIGTEPAYLKATNTTVARGEAFGDADINTANRVLLLGQTAATELFGTADPVGQRVDVGGVGFTVVGVLAAKDAAGFNDPNDVAVAPLPAVQAGLAGYGGLSSIVVQATGPDAVDPALTEVTSILNSRHRVTDAAASPYRVQNQAQLLATRSETAQTFTVLLGTVAAISLLVGGIGITNIMLVTVTERTREIGIRKALGAPRRSILGQFLAEATLLSLLGGGLGVVVALVASGFTLMGVKPVVVPGSVLLALGVSVAIGLFFGSFPAHRAASLRPIEALRYE